MFSYGLLHMDTPVLANQQIYIHQLCVDTECNLEDLQGTINDRDGWLERESVNSVLSVWLDDNHYR